MLEQNPPASAETMQDFFPRESEYFPEVSEPALSQENEKALRHFSSIYH